MTKHKTQFVCQQCGAQFTKWAGKCSSCGEWNTLVEQVIETAIEKKSALARGQASGKKLNFTKINDVKRMKQVSETIKRLTGENSVVYRNLKTDGIHI